MRPFRFVFPILCVAAAAVSAPAQPAPKLNSLSREWLQRGTKAEITLYGENLAGATNVLISGAPGLSASIVPPQLAVTHVESSLGGISSVAKLNGNEVRVTIDSEANAALASREIRLVTPAGVSNPLDLHLAPLPQVDSGSNQARESAQKITLPVIIGGAIQNAAESDFFSFEARKGEHVIIDVDAFRSGSKLDSSLAVLDSSGKELARSEDAAGLDSVIDFAAPADGQYLIQLRDFRYQGGADYKYRMTVGVLPHVTRSFPFGAQRGSMVSIALTGVNLDSENLLLALAPDAPAGPQEIRVATARGLSNPFPLEVSDLPSFTESEPNSALDQADRITIPVAVDGHISQPKDYDAFRFHADKDQRIVFEVQAYRFGSRLDAVLTLTDWRGNVLARNDDSSATDAKIDFTFREPGDYHIIVEDLLNRGGSDFGYRLSAAAPQPDFSLAITRDTLRLHRGGRTPLRCELNRMNGFEGPVKIICEDLPSGVYADPVTLDGSAASAMLLIQATDEAPLGSFPLRVVALGRQGASSTRREAQPLSGDRTVKAAFLTVLDRAPFAIAPATSMATVEQNQSAALDVIVERRNAFAGDIRITAEGFSSGRDPITRSFDLQPITLKGNESRGTLTLRLKTDSEIGTRPVILRAEAESGGAQVVDFSSLIPVRATQIPFILTTSLKKLVVTALPAGSGSAASEAVFTVKCERRAGFDGAIDLKLDGVPDGVAATVSKIPEKAGEVTIKLIASEKAPTGKDVQLTLTGTGMHNDRIYRFPAAPLTLTINAPENEENKQPKLANSK